MTTPRPAPDTIAHRAASFQPSSFNEAENTVDLVWTTGAAVTRFDWLDGEIYSETLSTNPSAVRLARLNDGGPVLLDHVTAVGSLVGSVVPGSARLEGGKGVATVRLIDPAEITDPAAKDAVAKVRAGHLRNVSVGYMVHTYQRTESADRGRAELCAVDWEPTEISLTPVPADPGCQVRSRSNAAMPDIIETQDLPVRGAITAEAIRRACDQRDYSRSFERELLEEHKATPLTRAALTERMTAEYARMIAAPQPINNSDTATHNAGGPVASMARAMEDAIFARMSGKEPSAAAREFMGSTLIDMTRGLLEARGERARWMSPSKLVDSMTRFGAHTTSDFPVLMGNAAHRYLVDIFNSYPSPLKALTVQRTAPDFRRISLVKVGQNPQLLAVRENGEITRGGVLEASEGYSLGTYARIFAITRQALINDDLGAFTAVFQGWGRSAAELEASTIAALIYGNAAMSDGNYLFSAAHGNLAGAGGPITIANLGAARLAMRMQKDLDGTTPVDAAPKFLVVGAAKETEAEAVLAQIAAATVGDVNPFSGKLTLLVDPRLPGTAWYLFADPARWPVIEIAKLSGQEDVFVDTRVGFDVDGVETKARLDIGGAAVDWRGGYKNPGA